MARKFKRAAKSCLLIDYPAGSGSLKEEKSCKLIIYLSGPRSFKESQSCLLFVYPAGPGNLKERTKVVYCLIIRQGREV